jgi:hypothetical protein
MWHNFAIVLFLFDKLKKILFYHTYKCMYSEVKVMARNKYPEKIRKAILDSAVRLFTIYGWEKVTIQEVIDDVGGITRGHFIISLNHVKT